MQGRARPAWAAATVASRTARPPGPPREPASGAPPCALAPLGSSGSSLSPWFLLQCSPPCPLWPFAPAACRPPLLALSAGPSVRAGHPKPNFKAERNCPGRGAAGRPRRGPLDNLSQVGALALSSARLAAAVQSLPRGTGLGRHLSPRRRGKGTKVCLLRTLPKLLRSRSTGPTGQGGVWARAGSRAASLGGLRPGLHHPAAG